MCLVLNHFRSHVLQGTTEGVPLLIGLGLHAPAKIADFNNITLFDQNIFGLNVSMNETLLVHVIYTRTNLDEKVEGGILRKASLLANQVE